MYTNYNNALNLVITVQVQERIEIYFEQTKSATAW